MPDPYANNSSTVDAGAWTHNATDVTLSNVSDYMGRVGGYVIGSDPSNPGAGALLAGLVVGAAVMGVVGTSRAGPVGGAVAGVTTVAVLSQSAGLLPRWLFGGLMMLVALMAAAVYWRWQ